MCQGRFAGDWKIGRSASTVATIGRERDDDDDGRDREPRFALADRRRGGPLRAPGVALALVSPRSWERFIAGRHRADRNPDSPPELSAAWRD
jgi:hypothetical protein